MPRRILATGATGAVGGALMRCLSDEARSGRIELLGAARSQTAADKLRAEGFTPVVLDYDRPETLRPALAGVDAVFLSTGYTVDMLIHSKRLLNAAKAEGVRHVVHLGALAVDDTPHAQFAWHQMVEHTIEGMGFTFTHLRPNFFIDTAWEGFRRRPDRLIHFVGDRRVSWIAAEDIAAVAAAALLDPARHAGQIYPLAVEALTLSEVAAILSDVIGRPVAYQPRPALDLLPILLKQGMEPAYATGLAGSVVEIEAGTLPDADMVSDAVATITGRKPIGWRDYALKRRGEAASS